MKKGIDNGDLREAVRIDLKAIKKHKNYIEEEEYYDEEISINSAAREEEEYLDFLMEFGHIDFFLLNFLPCIRTVPEFKEFRDN